MRHRYADGWSDEIIRDEAIDGAVPNFTHSMDAAHLIFIVLMLTEPWRLLKTSGNVVTVHDCFACHAPDADNLKAAIRETLWMMYRPHAPVPKHGLPSVSPDRNHLADLRNVNSRCSASLHCPDETLACPCKLFLGPTPPMGSMNVDDVLKSKYDWH